MLIAALLALATQEQPIDASPSAAPPLVSPARVTLPTKGGRLWDPKQRAAEVCTDDGTALMCNPDMLAHFNVVSEGTITLPPDIAATSALTLNGGAGCVVAVDITMKGERDLFIDWSLAALTVDGVAVQVAPGFARKISSALAQRPSTAAPGAVLAEGVYAVGDGDCLTRAAPRKERVEIALRLPIRHGGDAVVVDVAHTLRWEAAPEQWVVDLLDPGLEVAPPERPLVWTIAGASVGVGIAATMGAVIGAQQNYQTRDPLTSVGIGVAVCGVYAACCGGPLAGAGWLFFDAPAWRRADEKDETIARRNRIRDRQTKKTSQQAF